MGKAAKRVTGNGAGAFAAKKQRGENGAEWNDGQRDSSRADEDSEMDPGEDGSFAPTPRGTDDDGGAAIREQSEGDATSVKEGGGDVDEDTGADSPGKAEQPAPPLTLVGAWDYRENSIALTGADDELVVLLAPFETLYLQGSVSVSVLAGTASCFGAMLTPAGWGPRPADAATPSGGRSVQLHAVAPYGPLGVQAAGAAARQLDSDALAACGAGAGRGEKELERLGGLLAGAVEEGRVAAALLLQRLDDARDTRLGQGAGRRAGGGARGKGGRAAWWREGDGGCDKLTDKVLETVGCRVLLARARAAPTAQPHAVPADWRALGDMAVQLAGAGRPGGGGLRLALVGAKGSGKSTLARFLLNRLLSRWPAGTARPTDRPRSSPRR